MFELFTDPGERFVKIGVFRLRNAFTGVKAFLTLRMTRVGK